MSEGGKNIIMRRTSGSIGKSIVYRDYNGKSVVSKHPDMSKVVRSPAQRASSALFRKAMAHAQAVLKDPVQREQVMERIKYYKDKGYRRACGLLVREYINANKVLSQRAAEKLTVEKFGSFPISLRQLNGLIFLTRFRELSNSIYQGINKVSKPTATRDLQDLIRQCILVCEGRGAGANYKFADNTNTKEVE